MHSPLIYETPIIESNKDTVGDTYRSLEEKVNLLNIEVIAMKSSTEDQMLILTQAREDSTLKKSPFYHKSEIAREEIAYLRNKNRTKSCIIQTLLENGNTQQNNKSLQHLIRVTLKDQINVSKALKITQQIIRIYPHLIDTKNCQRMIILKTRVILWIM